MMLKTRHLLWLIYFCVSSSLFAANYNYGMHFTSYPAKVIDMSSLILENDRPIKIEDETTISFEMCIRNESAFGTVFRIITNDEKNIDLLFTVEEGDRRSPILVIQETVHPIVQEIVYNQWIPVSITFSSRQNEILLSYGMTRLSVPYPVSGINNIRMTFGQCLYKGFSLPDVASINLRDIRIFQNKKLTRYWKLEKHSGVLCYDSIHRIPAIATNPRWLIDEYATWKKVLSTKLPENTSITFNPQEQDFYFISSSGDIEIFHTETKEMETLKNNGGKIASSTQGRISFDTKKNQLISYNIDETTLSFFSFDTQMWSNNRSFDTDPLINNSAIYWEKDNSIFSFGGYSHYKYNNELIKIDLKSGSKEKRILSEIHPRYSAATAIVDNALYIFGGRGCESGRQELSPHNYYDLYRVDLTTWKVIKVWECESVEDDFLPANNMIYDEESKCFYILSTAGSGNLLKLDPEKENLEPISLSVNTHFSSQYLFFNLYHSPKQKLIYALIFRSGYDNTDVDIFSLSYPPISLSVLYQEHPEERNEESKTSWFIFIIVGGLILPGGGIYYFLKRRKSGKSDKIVSSNPVKTVLSEKITANPSAAFQRENNNSTPAVRHYDFSKQCICLLGGFIVKDQQGNDMTEQFTPLLKHLLILLILHTVNSPKGISGSKLIQYLWFDKSEESAKNNRNVYLSKLRTVLEKVGNVEMINKNSFWTIKLGENVVCDYMEAMKYFSEIKENTIQEQANHYKLQELLLRGTLLPNTEVDWVDNFKSDFSNMTIDILYELFVKNQHNFDNDFKFKIADTIFLHDFINEEALYIKCSILCDQGKKGIARNIYDNFCKEYQNLMGTPYKNSLSDLINRRQE